MDKYISADFAMGVENVVEVIILTMIKDIQDFVMD